MLDHRSVQQRLELDADILTALREKKDDSMQLHTVDHHFFADREIGLKTLAYITGILGFKTDGPKPSTHRDGTERFVLDVQDRMPTILRAASRTSILMSALADAFRVTYDGWGTFGIPKQAIGEGNPLTD